MPTDATTTVNDVTTADHSQGGHAAGKTLLDDADAYSKKVHDDPAQMQTYWSDVAGKLRQNGVLNDLQIEAQHESGQGLNDLQTTLNKMTSALSVSEYASAQSGLKKVQMDAFNIVGDLAHDVANSLVQNNWDPMKAGLSLGMDIAHGNGSISPAHTQDFSNDLGKTVKDTANWYKDSGSEDFVNKANSLLNPMASVTNAVASAVTDKLAGNDATTPTLSKDPFEATSAIDTKLTSASVDLAKELNDTAAVKDGDGYTFVASRLLGIDPADKAAVRQHFDEIKQLSDSLAKYNDDQIDWNTNRATKKGLQSGQGPMPVFEHLDGIMKENPAFAKIWEAKIAQIAKANGLSTEEFMAFARADAKG